MVLNSDIQGSFKKCPLLFRQAEMVFVVAWLLDHFTLKSTTSMNGIWIITFVSHLHVWVMKFKPSLVFFQLPILTSNNVVWVSFSTVKASTAGYVPLCYEIVNFVFFFLLGLSMIFTESQNLLLMSLTFFLFVNSRAWTRFVRSSISIACNLSRSCCRT